MTSLVKVMLLFDMVVDAVGARARRAVVQQHERSDRNGAVFQSTTPPNNKHEYRRGGWTRCCLTVLPGIAMTMYSSTYSTFNVTCPRTRLTCKNCFG